jgi:hypothetical protein
MSDEKTTAATQTGVLRGGELATVVLDLIEANLMRWNQGAWRADTVTLQPDYCANPPTEAIEAHLEDPLNPDCTTSFCFAGWIAALDGVKWGKHDQESVGWKGTWDDPQPCDCTSLCCTDTAHQTHISHYARHRLGIASHEGDALFSGDNDLSALRIGVEAINDGRDVDDAIRSVIGYDEENDDDY